MRKFQINDVVKPREPDMSGKLGRVVGGWTRCQLEGCNGQRIFIRWPDGKLTKPCSKGLEYVTTDHAIDVTTWIII